MSPSDEQSVVGKAQEIAERAADFSLQDAADRVSEVGERMQSGIEEVNQHVGSVVERINFDETTIPDAFRKVPKLISPKVHRWLDIAVSGYFVGLHCLVRDPRKDGRGHCCFPEYKHGRWSVIFNRL